MTNEQRQREAEALAEQHDAEEEWPSGELATSSHLGAYIPPGPSERAQWLGIPTDGWRPDTLAEPSE